MKKILSYGLLSILTISLVSPMSAYADTKIDQEEVTYQGESNEFVNLSETDLNELQKSVKINENGHIYLENVPSDQYKNYGLQYLEEHFNLLNEKVDNGQIIINQDLSITDLTVKARAVYGEWTNHWWGYDRKFGKIAAEKYATECNKLATKLAMGAAVASPVWWVSAGIALSSGYYYLLSTDVNEANAKSNKGVEVKIYWTRNYSVKPLY